MLYYVAGASHDLDRIHAFMQAAEVRGHRLIRDWTVTVRAAQVAGTTDADLPDEQAQQIAQVNVASMLRSEVLVFLAPAEGGRDCWAELGAAVLASGVGVWPGTIVMVGGRESIIGRLAGVQVETDAAALEELDALQVAVEQVRAQTEAWRCRGCGCTNGTPCEGGCWWVEPNLCSQCADQKDDAPRIITGVG